MLQKMNKFHGRLVLIFLAALIVRVLCAVIFSGEIDTEGAEYARIAQNIVAGKGYVGIATEGTQLFFPPLFPLLIAAVSFLTGDAEIAGRVINVVFGSLLVFPVCFIGRRLFGEGIGLGGAALAAIHPYLVVMSSTVVGCEPTYLVLLLMAVFLTMRIGDAPSWREVSICGAFYGVAYLVRPEAFVYMIVGLIYILVEAFLQDRRKFVATASRIWLIPVCFFIVAGPYIGWLSLQTGQLRMEDKSPLNIETEIRIQKGIPADEAAAGVDKDLTAQGVWIQPNINIIRSHAPLSIRQYVTMIAKMSKVVLQNASATIGGNLAFGSPALFAFAILGLFSRPWHPRHLVEQLHLISLLSLTVFATFFTYWTNSRFYVLILVIFCIWAGAGVVAIEQWANRTASAFGLANRKQIFFGDTAQLLAVLTILAPSAAWASSAFLSTRDTWPIKVAAFNLARSGHAMRFADESSPFAFHAHADWIWLPYCDEQTALQYLRKKGVTHVVVNGSVISARPYLKKWMEDGVPDSREVAELSAEHVRVFELSLPK